MLTALTNWSGLAEACFVIVITKLGVNGVLVCLMAAEFRNTPIICQEAGTGLKPARHLMEEQKKPGDNLAYRIAARMFESAFAACERLPEGEQQLLLREIGKRILKNISPPAMDTVKSIQVVGIEIKQHDSDDDAAGPK